MKKIKIIILFLTSNLLFSQDFKEVFLGNNVDAYKGTYFKIKDNDYNDFYMMFYENLNILKDLKYHLVIFPNKKSREYTLRDSLNNKEFFVKDIVNIDGKPYNKDEHFTEPIFVLQETNSKKIIYYRYKQSEYYEFPFFVKSENKSIDLQCNLIQRKIDDFTGEITLRSPINYKSQNIPFAIIKTIKNSVTKYYLSLSSYGLNVSVDINDITILFDDNSKLNKKSKIDVNVAKNGNGYRYSAFIPITQQDLDILSTKKIIKYRLYIYDYSLNDENGEMFKSLIKCIRKLK